MKNCPWPYPQAGDVITVLEDGANWGDLVIGGRPANPAFNPADVGFAPGDKVFTDRVTGQTRPISEDPNGNHNQVRIIKLPNVTSAQASNLLSGERAADMQHPSPLLQFRQFYFDRSKIPAGQVALLQNLADDLRTNAFVTLSFTAAQLATVVSQRPPLTQMPA